MIAPRVSVAIAFHDEEAHLARAIRSILAQTFESIELLLLDDGSTDRSVAIARSFLQDPRVRLFVDGTRRHLGARLNQALLLASGALFARMDADDLSAPERLARQVKALDAAPELEGVGTWAALLDEADAPFAVIEAAVAAPTAHSLLTRGLVSHATLLARTRWLRAQGYDETIHRAEDRDLWCRVGRSHRVGVVPELLYFVRVEPRKASFLANYRKGQADFRRVILRHGPTGVGTSATTALVASSLTKEQLFRLAHALGLEERLTRRRGRPLTIVERARVEAMLRQIP